MLIGETNISQCLHWWSAERIAPSGRISVLEETVMSMLRAKNILNFMFQPLDLLYVTTRRIPSPWTSNIGLPAEIGGAYNLVISPSLSSVQYTLLRIVLSLTSDVHLSCQALIKTGNLMELEYPVRRLFQNIQQFRMVRNFFTHLDGVLSNPDKEGITGATQTNCGIKYTDTTKGCVHLVFVGNKIHFSYHKKAMEVDLGKSTFNCIFESARLIYAELTSHKVHAQSCHHSPANSLYPL